MNITDFVGSDWSMKIWNFALKNFVNIYIYIYIYIKIWPHLWSSGQSSWLQIQTSWFNSRRYQIFWEVVGLERRPLSLVNATEELLGRKSSGSGLESGEYGRGDPSRWPLGTHYPQKIEGSTWHPLSAESWRLALTSTTSGGRSVGIIGTSGYVARNSDH
jgi:hypothetical protein